MYYYLLLIAAAAMLTVVLGCASGEDGRFVRTVWGPLNDNMFRVNSPDTATSPYKDRPLAKQLGLMMMTIDEDPSAVTAAELYLELWGGHPGVANKRFSLNGSSEYPMGEVGTAEGHCTYSYPAYALKLSDLKVGENAFQFACVKGTSFWGHFLMRQAAVRFVLPTSHPRITSAGLADFSAAVVARADVNAESVRISLNVGADYAGRIASVEYQGRYAGYDENGNRDGNDWHGYTKDRKPIAIIDVAQEAPFEVSWDTSMLPDQPNLAVRAIVRFKDPADISYETPPVTLDLPARPGRVVMYPTTKMDKPFSTRVNRLKYATIHVADDPADIQRAQLHVVIWDGGSGGLADHFTLNGQAFEVAATGMHDVLYRILDIDPKLLRRGDNEIRVVSSTEHHGIEVLLPGPALVVRTATP